MPGADGGPDPLFQDYLRGLYLLDPFYIASRENRAAACSVWPTWHRNASSRPITTSVTSASTWWPMKSRSTSSSPANAPSACRSARGAASPRATRRARSGAALGGRADAPAPGLRGRSVEQPCGAGAGLAGFAGEGRGADGHAADGARTGGRQADAQRLLEQEIARKLAISAETVKVHRKHMYGKLGIKSQSELFGLFLQAQG